MLVLLLAALLETTAPLTKITSVGRDFPATPNPSERYVIYLHGRIVEDHGLQPRDPQFGVYHYEGILRTLEAHGLRVISEARPQGADPQVYARRVADQVTRLIQRGVPAEHITVIGASKGAVIAMLVSTKVADPRIRYVLLSDCNDDVFKRFDIRLHGAVLSIYDEGDPVGGTCQKFFDRAAALSQRREIALHLGIGHALLYGPRSEWIDPAVRWAKE